MDVVWTVGGVLIMLLIVTGSSLLIAYGQRRMHRQQRDWVRSHRYTVRPAPPAEEADDTEPESR